MTKKPITEEMAARGLERICWDCIDCGHYHAKTWKGHPAWTDKDGITHQVSHDDPKKTVCGKAIP